MARVGADMISTTLRAADPRDHLAALGVMRVLLDAGHAPTLAWESERDTHAHAWLERVQPSDLLEALAIDLDAWRSSPLSALDISEWPIPHPAMRPTREERQAAAIVGHDEHGQRTTTLLDFAAGQATMARWLERCLRQVTPQRICDELAGRRHVYAEPSDLRWEAVGPRLSALSTAVPIAMGLDYLAWRGLTARPLMTGLQSGVELTRNDHVHALTWPVWTEPAGWDLVVSLLGSLVTWRARVVRYGLNGAYRTFAPAVPA